jgi:competence protein ComEA
MKKATVSMIAITAAFLCVLLGLFIGRQSPSNRITLYHSDNIVNNEPNGLVNINTATLEELEILPGLGPTLALRIIEYRNEHGPFQKPEDICLVNGIGSKTFSKFEKLITVGGNYEDTGS